MPRQTYDQDLHLETHFEPTKMDILVGLVSQNAKSEARGSVHPISVRIPTMPFTTIQAISKHSGMSINKTIVVLLEAALDGMFAELDQSDHDAIQNLRSDFLKAFIESGEYPQATKGEI